MLQFAGPDFIRHAHIPLTTAPRGSVGPWEPTVPQHFNLQLLAGLPPLQHFVKVMKVAGGYTPSPSDDVPELNAHPTSWAPRLDPDHQHSPVDG